MEAVLARYLTTRRLTDQPGTVRVFDKAIRRLITWLAGTYPQIETFTQVSRDHLMEFAEYLSTMISPATGKPLVLAWGCPLAPGVEGARAGIATASASKKITVWMHGASAGEQGSSG